MNVLTITVQVQIKPDAPLPERGDDLDDVKFLRFATTVTAVTTVQSASENFKTWSRGEFSTTLLKKRCTPPPKSENEIIHHSKTTQRLRTTQSRRTLFLLTRSNQVSTTCPACQKTNQIVNQCGCDKNNLPTTANKKYTVRYTVEFETTIEATPETLADEVSNIDIPENDSRYVADSFEVNSVRDAENNYVELNDEDDDD